MRKRTRRIVFGLQLVLLMCFLSLPVLADQSTSAEWKEQYFKVAEAAASNGENPSFFLMNLDGDNIPELIVNRKDGSGRESLYYFEEGRLNEWTCEAYSLRYIPGADLVRTTTQRKGMYTDSFYRRVNGQFILLASGTYELQAEKPDQSGTGEIILNDKFVYRWMNQEMDSSTYRLAVQAVYDTTKDTSPYVTEYDPDTLKAALDSEEDLRAVYGTGEKASDEEQPAASADIDAAETEEYQMTFVSSDVSKYPKVRLYFSLEDDDGQPVTLTSFDGKIKESIKNGKKIERTIRKIERLEGNQGLSIDIVADKSGSMDYDLPIMQGIMSDFVRSLDYGVGDQVEILSFDSYVMYMCTYTNDVSLLLNGISNMTAYGETSLYDALMEGIENAGSRAGARCVIGFTDGEDNRSSYTPEDVIRASWEMEVPVYLIGTGGANNSKLQYIAESTGGYYWNVRNITDIGTILSTIYSNQKDLYCIEYKSDPDANPYAARKVNCSITDGRRTGRIRNLKFRATPVIKTARHKSRYELIKADVSWQEANDACIERGGHLVTLTSPAEMDEIVRMCENAGMKYCWIGGYTSVRRNIAFGHWITGESFNFTSWYPGEPSRNDLDGTPEFYLMLWNVEGVWSWNDQRNDVVADYDYFKGVIGYVCEYEN